MSYKCVIFDFDGTLADTEHQVFKIYNQLAEKYGYKKISEEELTSIKHLNLFDFIKSIDVPYIKIPLLLREGQKILKEKIEEVKTFQDNTREIMLKIRSRVDVLGIITSNTSKNVRKFLKNQDLDLFDFIESSSLLGKEKKLNIIRKRYELKSSDILYIGDETRDIDACKKAGVSCAAVCWGYNYMETLEKYKPNYIIEDLSDILNILKNKEV